VFKQHALEAFDAVKEMERDGGETTLLVGKHGARGRSNPCRARSRQTVRELLLENATGVRRA
jgi:hypothetical protein